ncbi:hypothetical protein ACFFMR_18995 [Micromonospora andamanensis]|uniref:ATP-grasp target RiPP n=1 Tax=Micromonospora andamanensis TaxID=1287068 RepID=A0ABQ4HYN4_9ACTN|nr:hypothetical protein [Micromonospora andamanensis]GIJ10755.1 hypothetical protein Van01_39690 [Micromonospora andamanensis]
MSTTSLPRIPKTFGAGASVAVRLPFGEGSVAHRVKYDPRPNGRFYRGEEQTSLVPLAACAPEDDPCVELSGGWADHQGAQACTEDACFPDAEPR